MSGQSYAWRRRNLDRLLFSATALFSRVKLRSVHAGGFAAVTEVQMALVQNLDLHGTRLTTLAARAGVPKQSMLALVNAAEALGIVERRSDPRDRRAKRVVFTAAGLAMLERVREGVALAERRMEAVVGAAFIAEMKECLDAYIAAAHPAADELRLSDGNAAWRMLSVNRVLFVAAAAFARDVVRTVREAGFDALVPAHLALFRNLDVAGTRLTTIASRARVTKQAMAELVDRVEALGLVARHPDPYDGRAKVIVFTPEGFRLLDGLRNAIEAAERRMAAATGAPFVDALRARLAAYVEGGDAGATRQAPALLDRS